MMGLNSDNIFNRNKKIAGFTLIEVLVAIAVIGFVFPALMTLMIKQADYAGIIRNQTIAMWVAENKMTDLRLERVFLQRISQRGEKFTTEMAGQEWTVIVDPDATSSTLTKYTITVELEPDKPLAILESFVNNG
ncbi:MAG: type II secretion system minor pseudopilin GspI [Cellvibrionaceae bacterium]